jgi:hypothetical protein
MGFSRSIFPAVASSFTLRMESATYFEILVSIYQIIQLHIHKDHEPSQPHYGPEFDSVSNRNEYQESFWGGKGRPARKADNLTVICDLIV